MRNINGRPHISSTAPHLAMSVGATRQGFFYGAYHQPTNIRLCAEVPDESDRKACIGMQVMMTAQRTHDPKLCERIPKSEARTYSLCRNFFEGILPHGLELECAFC